MTTDRADTRSVDPLASGQISADEAAQRLRPPAGPQSGTGKATANLNGRWLHVRVTDLETGKQKANVNLPLTWVEVGMRIGAQYRPEIASFDFGDLVAQIQAGAEGKLVEVEDLEDNERVEIFVD
jgi:hypothetical protein